MAGDGYVRFIADIHQQPRAAVDAGTVQRPAFSSQRRAALDVQPAGGIVAF